MIFAFIMGIHKHKVKLVNLLFVEVNDKDSVRYLLNKTYKMTKVFGCSMLQQIYTM